MTRHSKIYIVISFYNGSETIGKTIDSVLSQKTDRPLECIIIDDGSSSDQLESLKSICQSKKSIKIHSKSNAGVASARNFGFKIAAANYASYVLFLDQDDELYSNAIESLGLYLDEHSETSVVYGRAYAIDKSSQFITGEIHRGKRYKVTLSGMKFIDDNIGKLSTDYLLMDCCISSPGQALIRMSDLLNLAGPFNENLKGVDDWDLWLRISFNHEILGVDIPILKYRVHENNVSKDLSKMRANGLAMRKSWLSILSLRNKIKLVLYYLVRVYSRF